MVCGLSNASTKSPVYFAFALLSSSLVTCVLPIFLISFKSSTTELSVTALRTLAVALKREAVFLFVLKLE